MANTETAPDKAGPSLIIQLGALLLMTLAAAGTGILSGKYLSGDDTAAPAAQPHAAGDAPLVREEGHGAPSGSETIIALGTITTNLAGPGNFWVRMELSIVLDEPQAPELPELIHQDLLAFVRTVKMHQIEGASGFQHFKADLEERAAIRSDGQVKQVLIRTLLFE